MQHEADAGATRRGATPARSGARLLGGGLSCVIISRDAGYALALARAAEVQHISATLLWSVVSLEKSLLFRPDLVLVEQELWPEYLSLLQRGRLHDLRDAQTMIISDHRGVAGAAAPDAAASLVGNRMSVLIDKHAGPQAAVQTALRALREDSVTMLLDEPAASFLPLELTSGPQAQPVAPLLPFAEHPDPEVR